MKKILRKLLQSWLFPNVIELSNAQLSELKVEVEPIKKRSDFLKSAHNIYNESAFQLVINQLTERQVDHSIRLADCWERVLFDRATINGFSLLKEEFEELENEYLRMVQPQETFNKNEII